jgi:hypothetical protein
MLSKTMIGISMIRVAAAAWYETTDMPASAPASDISAADEDVSY